MSSTLRVALDNLDLVGLLERECEAHANIAATSDDNATHGIFKAAHLTHENANVFTIGDEKDFIVLLDDRISVGKYRLALTINSSDTSFGVRNVFFQRGDTLTDKKPVAIRPGANQPYSTAGEVQNLRCARIKDQLLDVLTNQLLRADTHINGNGVLREQVFGVHVFRRANTSDLGRRVKQGVSHLARDHVRFVGVGQRDNDIRIVGTCPIQNVGVRGMTDHGANIQAILQLAQDVRTPVDHSDLIGLFARQVIRR